MALSPTLVDREQGKFRDAGAVTSSRVAIVPEGSFQAPQDTDAIVVTYPSATVEVYAFKSGGTGGTTLMTLTVTYTTASKNFISSVVKT